MKSNGTSASNTTAPERLQLAPSKTFPEQDYPALVTLLTRFSQNANRLADMQRQIDGVLLAAAEEMQAEHTQLQEQQAAIEQGLERIARAHPEWFDKKKSLTTPVGVVKLTATTVLDVADEELAIALLDRYFPDTAALYTRLEKSLNKEALEGLDDGDLKKLKITRVRGESFKVTASKVALGEAVAKAKEVRK